MFLGVVIGIIYALTGLGLTLVFGVMRIANFAHGEFYMLGGYSAYFFITLYGLPPYVAIPLAMATVFLLGLIIERTLLRPMTRLERPAEYAIFITFTLRLLFVNLAIIIFGPFYRKPPDFISQGFWLLSGNEVVALVTSIAMIATVTLLVGRTRIGRNWRAMSEDRRTARILGVNVNKMNSLVFGAATALAALAGALMGPVYLVGPTVGTDALLRGYVIIAIGGMGSIPGTVAGGILLGIVEGFGSVFIAPAYKTVYGFLLMLIFLIVKPTGLFGWQE